MRPRHTRPELDGWRAMRARFLANAAPWLEELHQEREQARERAIAALEQFEAAS